ncbi:hypothetical protein H5410_008086, partial [Solanum commersonii]
YTQPVYVASKEYRDTTPFSLLFLITCNTLPIIQSRVFQLLVYLTKTSIFARVPSSSPTFLTKVKILLPTPMEVKLWNDKREREMYENFAELFAIIKATEKLEKAYVRDIISPAEYEAECQKLIAHFKTLSSTLKDTVPSIEQFHDTYKMDCPAALNRLVTSGVPATVEHRAPLLRHLHPQLLLWLNVCRTSSLPWTL